MIQTPTGSLNVVSARRDLPRLEPARAVLATTRRGRTVFAGVGAGNFEVRCQNWRAMSEARDCQDADGTTVSVTVVAGLWPRSSESRLDTRGREELVEGVRKRSFVDGDERRRYPRRRRGS